MSGTIFHFKLVENGIWLNIRKILYVKFYNNSNFEIENGPYKIH